MILANFYRDNFENVRYVCSIPRSRAFECSHIIGGRFHVCHRNAICSMNLQKQREVEGREMFIKPAEGPDLQTLSTTDEKKKEIRQKHTKHTDQKQKTNGQTETKHQHFQNNESFVFNFICEPDQYRPMAVNDESPETPPPQRRFVGLHWPCWVKF